MNNILIHCAMEKEGEKIARKLDLEKIDTEELLTVYRGIIKETQMNLIITGIGKQKTAIGLTKYLCKNRIPDLIINIGYAGSTNTEIGKWISIDKSYNLEWYIPGEEKYSMLDFGNQELETIEELEKLPCYSSETFVTKTDIKENVIFDMELHSVSIIADMYKIPLISMKKISDNLNMDDYYKNIETENIMELESSVFYIEKYIK